MGTRTKNSFRNIISGIVNKIICLLLPFATRTAIIHYLGVEYIGVGSLFSSILQILSLTELGFGSAITFALYKPLQEQNKEKVCAILNYFKKICIIIGSIIFCIGLCTMPFLRFLIKEGCPNDLNIYILFFMFLLNTSISYTLFGYASIIFNAHQRSDISSNISTILNIVKYSTELVVLVLFKNYYAYICVFLIFGIGSNVVSKIMSKIIYKDFVPKGDISPVEKQQFKQNIKDLFGHKVSGVFFNSFDSIVISVFLGARILGLYNNYYYIMSAVASILIIVSSSLTASIGNKMASESVENNYKLYKKLSFGYNWLVSFCTVCLFCLFQPFMTLWSNFSKSSSLLLNSKYVILICIYFYLYSVRNINCIFKDAAGLWHRDRWRPYVESAVNLICNLILVNFIGLYGIIISTIIALLVSNPWMTNALHKEYFKTNELSYYKSSFINIIITVASCIFVGWVCQLLGTGIANFIVKCFICCAIPNLILLISYFKTKNFKSICYDIKKIIKPKKNITE